MKRKKEGASLIVVIIVFMFVTTVSMAMLSMVAGNYKSRVVESKRIENLYASDSGLDVAYNIMAKTFDSATKYGYYKVQALKNLQGNSPIKPKYKDLEDDIKALEDRIEDFKKETPSETRTRTKINNDIKETNDMITESRSLEQILLNEEFKRGFRNFISQSLEHGENEADPATSDNLKYSIENYKVFDVSVSETNYSNIKFADKTVNFGIDNTKNVQPKLELGELRLVSGTSETKEYQLDGLNKKIEIITTPQQKYSDITVKATFNTEKFNGDNVLNGTNERKVQETFDMIVPNFNEAYYQEAASEMNEYLATKDRALTVHGNMNITGADNFTVNNGEIFVEGRTPTVGVENARSYEKYNGGIMVANSKDVKFTDNVITRNSFNIRSDANVTIGKNLYGRNVYLGGKYYSDDLSDRFMKGLDEVAVNSQLYVNSGDNDDMTEGQIIIDNDLALKAQMSEKSERSEISVKDFYGVNDKNIKIKDADGNLVDNRDAYGNIVNKVKSSSSIIVNASETDNSKIEIKNSAYIMGTAHINTNEKDTDSSNQYQTGESGAVKGNYIAYSVPLDELKETEQFFSYYDPLKLLDKVWNDTTKKIEDADVFDRANHFSKYWTNEIGKSHNPDTGGIVWPENKGNIWSVGAIVYKTGENKTILGSHYMSDLEEENVDPTDKNVGAVYNKQTEFAKKVYRFNQEATKSYDYDYEKSTDFTDLVKTGNIASEPSYQLEKQNNKGEYAIFNGDDTKEIKIVRSTASVDSIVNNTTDIVISVSNKGTAADPKYVLSSVIVTAGKLSIGDGITINGCVIVDGDLNINQKNVTINYDPRVIESVQAKNSAIFKTVFGGWIIPPDNNNSINNDSGTLASAYDLSHFLEKKLWQIKK